VPGAATSAAGDLVELECLELPIIAAALADLEYRDPFLLTVLAGESALNHDSYMTHTLMPI
jgi:hypothetical protein